MGTFLRVNASALPLHEGQVLSAVSIPHLWQVTAPIVSAPHFSHLPKWVVLPQIPHFRYAKSTEIMVCSAIVSTIFRLDPPANPIGKRQWTRGLISPPRRLFRPTHSSANIDRCLSHHPHPRRVKELLENIFPLNSTALRSQPEAFIQDRRILVHHEETLFNSVRDAEVLQNRFRHYIILSRYAIRG